MLWRNDYYPGGMTMPGRTYQGSPASKYRYSMNGQEKSDELNDNLTTAKYWEYDSRIVRRWNIDPKQKVWESPYLCFSGNPIFLSDPNGDEATDKGKKKKAQQQPKPKQAAKPKTETKAPEPPKTNVSDYSYSKLDDDWKETKNGGQSLLKKEKCLNNLADQKKPTNTCAIRFSYAANEAGYPIPASSPGIRITKGQEGDNGNYILGSQEVRTYLTKMAAPTIVVLNIKTVEDVNNLIEMIHGTSSDFKGIMVIRAGDTKEYEATGHVDLLYKDFMGDISMTARGGDDLKKYLKKEIKSDLSIYIWEIKD